MTGGAALKAAVGPRSIAPAVRALIAVEARELCCLWGALPPRGFESPSSMNAIISDMHSNQIVFEYQIDLK